MLPVQKATALASTLFEIGALSGSATQLHVGDYVGALAIAFVGCMCVIMIAGTVILAEVVKVRVRHHLRKKDDEHKPPDDPEKPDA